MRLVKGLYGSQFDGELSLFGLRCGQLRSNEDIAHNGGWYNQLGERIGWGDLNKADVERIKAELEPDEMFIILSEGDSFWNFVTNVGMIGSMCETNPTIEAPGRVYIAKHCRMIVRPGSAVWVASEHWPQDADRPGFISREEAKAIIVGLTVV